MDVLFFTDILEVGAARYTAPYRLATQLREEGHTCQIIDFFASFNDQQIQEILKKFISSKTKLLAFTNTFIYTKYTATKAISGSNQKHFLDNTIYGDLRAKIEYITFQAKKINPNIKTVMGGSSSHIIDINCIDYWITGLGDSSLPTLLTSIKNKTPIIRKKINQTTFLIDSNTEYPFDNFNTSTIKWTEQEAIQPEEWVPIEISRGCRFRCSFCYFPLNGKKAEDYLKTAEVLKNELIRNYEENGITHYIFSDDLYNDSIEKVEMYHKVFTSLPFKIKWVSYGRLDLIYAYPQMRELLLESGCVSLYLGIETFNKKAGSKVGKGLGKEKIIKTLKYLEETWKGKLNLGAGFIVGLPSETKESLNDTFNWLMSDENPLDFFLFYPLHIQEEETTDIYQAKMSSDPKKFGYEFENKHSEQWVSDQMTFSEANRIASKYNFTASQKTSLGGFMIPRLCNLGYDFSHFFNRNIIKDVLNNKENYKYRKSKFINTYLNQILDLDLTKYN